MAGAMLTGMSSRNNWVGPRQQRRTDERGDSLERPDLNEFGVVSDNLAGDRFRGPSKVSLGVGRRANCFPKLRDEARLRDGPKQTTELGQIRIPKSGNFLPKVSFVKTSFLSCIERGTRRHPKLGKEGGGVIPDSSKIFSTNAGPRDLLPP